MIDRTVRCTHKHYIEADIAIDFSELWDGAADEVIGRGAAVWAGGFSGRPELASQIMPIIKQLLAGKTPPRLKQLKRCLRQLFRFLDGYEAWSERHSAQVAPIRVRRLEDLTSHHFATWLVPAPDNLWTTPDGTTYGAVTQVIRAARQVANLPKIWIRSAPPRSTVGGDIIDEILAKQLVNALAAAANAIWRRWKRADALAERGRNLMELPAACRENVELRRNFFATEADLHATYRELVRRRGGLHVPAKAFITEFGYSKKTKFPFVSWWPVYDDDGDRAGKIVDYDDLRRGLFPTREDLLVLLLLFQARTGWNPSTCVTLDVSDDANWCAKYSEQLVWIFAYKTRSEAWQDTVAFMRKRTGPYQIIRRLIERTAILRQALDKDNTRCSVRDLAKRSPWLYVSFGEDVCVLDEDVTGESYQTLRRIIANHNSHGPDSSLALPENIRPTDMRDVFAAFTYKHFDYSPFMVQLALGHLSPRSATNYLRRKAWRAESERRKNEVIVALVDQIEVHRKIDVTLLRARMDGIHCTPKNISLLEEARRRRTYVGLGCTDPCHPPPFIDPHNPRDGTVRCSQGHRCASCPNGRVFDDSLPHLTKRVAELEWLQSKLPHPVFVGSSEHDDLEQLHRTLTQWSKDQVEPHIADWKARIETGAHRVIRFSGGH